MSILTDIFSWHAPGSAFEDNGAEAATGAGSSDAGKGNHHTLEFKDTPFISFMSRLKRMIDTDPREALRMIQIEKGAARFTRNHEKALIKDAEPKIAEALTREHPPSLRRTFFESVLDIPHRIAEAVHHHHPRPVPATTAAMAFPAPIPGTAAA